MTQTIQVPQSGTARGRSTKPVRKAVSSKKRPNKKATTARQSDKKAAQSLLSSERAKNRFRAFRFLLVKRGSDLKLSEGELIGRIADWAAVTPEQVIDFLEHRKGWPEETKEKFRAAVLQYWQSLPAHFGENLTWANMRERLGQQSLYQYLNL